MHCFGVIAQPAFTSKQTQNPKSNALTNPLVDDEYRGYSLSPIK
jgi:hypothetical protein